MKLGFFYSISLMLLLAGCKSEITFTPIIIPPKTDLLISEVSTAINTDPLAGGARSHYVELYNGTGNSIDLSNYAIGYFAVTDNSTLSNFSFAPGFFIPLQRILPNEKTYVIASPQCDPVAIKRDTVWGTTSTLAAQASTPLQLSGNSGIALLKKDQTGTIVLASINYRVIDVFGSPQVARVTSTGSVSTRNNIMWTVAGETADTRNRTFFRKSSVTGPTTDWALSKGTTVDNSQWKISGDRAWDYTNIGLPTP
jgi:Lamin Tail Domain